MEKPCLIAIAGTTASGKTAAAVKLCRAISGEVVSCDSMQVYRGMDIGTAKPDEAERGGVPHHMLDIVEPTESYSVSAFHDQAVVVIKDILSRGRQPVLCGGTGLYIDALTRPKPFPNRPTRRCGTNCAPSRPSRAAGRGCMPCLRRSIPIRPAACMKTTCAG